MKNISNKRCLLTTLFVASVAVVGCARDAAKHVEASSPGNDLVGSAKANTTLATQVGVEPGPVRHAESPTALLVGLEGEVEVRRLGEETFAVAKRDDALYLGDQVRAGEQAGATIVFSDESTAELAELSTLAIGSRVATADPASSAAVLSGVARFSVAPRAPGEGPFLVFSASGIVATKGTVFGVGVAANGNARVGVESGAVEVAGAAALDAPLTLEANAAVELTGAGKLAVPAPWTEDDWGIWRDRAEAQLDVAATSALHAEAMTTAASELEASHALLTDLGAQLAAFEASAAAQASSNDRASYTASLPQATVAIDASFLAALRLEYLTHAYLSHAVLASDLYVRHPKRVLWTTLEPHVQAAVLWPKRLDVMAAAYLEPLRIQYYLHHPRGRAHAQWVGVAVPSFYASTTPPAVPAADVAMKLKFKPFTPPAVKFTASARPIWIAAPSATWRAKAQKRAAPPRGKLAFWVRPPKLKAKAILGADVKAKLSPTLVLRPPAPRGQLKADWVASFGHKAKLAPPDLRAAAEARANWKSDLQAPDPTASLDAKHAAPELKGKVHGRSQADSAIKLHAHAKAKPYGHGKAAAAAKTKSGAGAAGNLKVKLPEPKAPKLKGEAKAHASFKLGH